MPAAASPVQSAKKTKDKDMTTVIIRKRINEVVKKESDSKILKTINKKSGVMILLKSIKSISP
tara:strand:- start:539 stop:727 length:189 start_codon:yes stop_codon:yes gene_type:complete